MWYDYVVEHPRISRFFRVFCRVFGHRWGREDETTILSYEPQIRSVCRLCGFDGGLI